MSMELIVKGVKTKSVTKRSQVFAKTKGRCAYCGTALHPTLFAVDHVHPKSRGGTRDLENLLPVCTPCNSGKGTKSLEDYRMYLAVKSVTGEAVFSHSHLVYLRNAGAFPLLGFDKHHAFFFEVME